MASRLPSSPWGERSHLIFRYPHCSVSAVDEVYIRHVEICKAFFLVMKVGEWQRLSKVHDECVLLLVSSVGLWGPFYLSSLKKSVPYNTWQVQSPTMIQTWDVWLVSVEWDWSGLYTQGPRNLLHFADGHWATQASGLWAGIWRFYWHFASLLSTEGGGFFRGLWYGSENHHFNHIKAIDNLKEKKKDWTFVIHSICSQ